jgi:hypothetical protein
MMNQNTTPIWDRSVTRLDELQSAYSDLYKDAYGFRPRHIPTDVWCDEAALEAELTALYETAQRMWDQEELAEAAIKAEEDRVAALLQDLTQVRPLRVSLFDLTK